MKRRVCGCYGQTATAEPTVLNLYALIKQRTIVSPLINDFMHYDPLTPPLKFNDNGYSTEMSNHLDILLSP